MANPAPAAAAERKVVRLPGKESKGLVLGHGANELVFAVVGHVGSGTTKVARTLKGLLEETSKGRPGYDVESVKAREVISEWAREVGKDVPTGKSTLDAVKTFQNLGDSMRLDTTDNAAVAVGMVNRIRYLRAQKQGVDPAQVGPIVPDGTFRAYILDSIRHPEEVELLRHIYQDAFILIGVVCEEQVRRERIKEHYDVGNGPAQIFMERDAKAGPTHGQRTSDAFHLSDFFIDNTEAKWLRNESAQVKGAPQQELMDNPEWTIPDHLSRLIKIITRETTSRRNDDEGWCPRRFGCHLHF